MWLSSRACTKTIGRTEISFFYAIFRARNRCSFNWLVVNVRKKTGTNSITCQRHRLAEPGVRLEIRRIQSERKILGVRSLISGPPDPQHRRSHIHAIVELLIVSFGDLKLLVHHAMMTGFRHGLISGLQRPVPLLERVRCVVLEHLSPLHLLQQESGCHIDEGCCAENAFHLYI